ncbi:OmpA family protein [Pontibacter toksunensis]|uniref:OmpA family protein n=1 Tax=Pontibacter toksunensis TaxID=1332631 RepID=A0ABW6BYG9_9BACT
MKKFLTLCMLLVSCQVAFAQHDLYNWKLSGYTGFARYLNDNNSSSDYFTTDNGQLYRLELTRHIGNSFGLSASYSFGEVSGNDLQQNPFTTDVRLSALRAYFYTDNGWLLNSSALVAPYVFAGYGLGILETSSGAITRESRYVPAIPLGFGLKFRLAERWQLALQTEAVYLTDAHLQGPDLEQNEYNSAFLHTGFTLGYSFGFKKSTFKAPRFYADNVALLQSVEGPNQPRQNELEMMLQIQPKPVQVVIAPNETVPTPTVITKRNVESPAMAPTTTGTTPDADTSSALAQIMRHRLVPIEPAQAQETTTRDLKTISSASTIIRLDSVVGNTTIQPAPAVRERVEVAGEPAAQTQPAVATQQRVQTQDSVITTTTITTTERAPITTQEAAPARAQQRAPVRTQEVAPVRTERRTQESVQEIAPARASETARVVERNVYIPSETRSAAVRTADAAQLREERLRINAVNAENRRLRSRIDSLQAVPQTSGDTLVSGPAAAVDTSMVQYLQQQAALNDSMLQRLNQYEQELALLKQANAAPAPVLAPVVVAPAPAPAPEEAPKGYTTSVFYPINAYRVPAESLRDLNQVLKALQENPDMKVRLTGHTSQSGNPAYNLALSRRRVEALESFLTDQGIAKQRISTQYLGDEKSSKKENPLDRKVEVQVFE